MCGALVILAFFFSFFSLNVVWWSFLCGSVHEGGVWEGWRCFVIRAVWMLSSLVDGMMMIRWDEPCCFVEWGEGGCD